MPIRSFKNFVGTPIGAISSIALMILTVEFLIMVLVDMTIRPAIGGGIAESAWRFLDPLLLTLIVTPGIYVLTVRPLERQQAKLREQFYELSIAAVTFESQEGVIVTDTNNNILKVNRSFTEITGYTTEDAVGNTPAMLHSGRQGKDFYRNMWQILERDRFWSGEIWNRRKNGEIYPEWLAITAVVGVEGKVTNYVGIFSDITERKAMDAEIQHLAFYDPLTKLPNRRLLINRLEQALASTARDHRYGALMFLDMDHFKKLNDVHGHDAGDQLLIEVARRISGCIREQDSASRFGGDEFVVMLEGLSGNIEQAALQAEIVAEKIRAALSEVYCLSRRAPSGVHDGEEIRHHCTSSIGITLFCGYVEKIDELLKWTDMAMYHAKNSGRNAIRFFDPAMQAAIESRANFEADMRMALEMGQFKPYYQVQVDSLQRPISAEVLLRWEHPQRGVISPSEFIPLAEETGLVLALGQWVLDAACAQLKSWQFEPGMRNLQLAVNVSAKQFHQSDFVGQVLAAVARHDINPLMLNLELTESMILEDLDGTILKMRELKEFGVRLSLDDFGTGYSSLSHLKQLPLDQVKIDQSFIRNIVRDRGDKAMVQAIMDLGVNFELEIIVEGIETEEQFKLLKRYGCSQFQGYLFSKALSVGRFEELIKAADSSLKCNA